ncbi:MAG TPA: glycosyltransferase family 4 protein [Pilimelia sp.]|nr:glycosyltransferase family 4 protein [Pilimelia sp.]
MELTVVCTYFPLPPDRGDPVRVLMILRAIARVRAYLLLVVRRDDTSDARVDELRHMLPGVRVEDFTATPYRLDRLGPAGRYPQALAAGLPPWVRTRYSRALHDRLRARTGLGLAIGEAAGAYFPGTSLRWHWDKANVLAASSRGDVDEAPGLVQRVRARYLAAASTRFERRALARCGTVSVTSAQEAQRLRHWHGRPADFTLASAVPVPDGHTRAPAERSLVWLGSFAYRSNALGLRRFLDAGWAPLSRAGWTLTLVGSGLTPRVRATLESYEGVAVVGYADDLRPVLGRARAGIVPLWSGAGVKLKTLTLLAHSVPVFSTRVGAEGVPPTAAVRVADTPTALAEAILGSSPATLDAMAAEALRLIRTEFSERRFADHLIQSLARCGYLHPAGSTATEAR